MAKAIITLKIMPKSPDTDLDKVQEAALEKIKGFAGEGETKQEIEPVAFGLKALKIIFVMDEAKGATDPLEKEIESIEGVNSVEVVDVRRAIG
ncbi:elongation factor 1-beta [Candidatus Woesearchaeota archaeon]|nr:elongation factor 1-beta [Candidatus Woesearchaeota archaeon]